MSTLSYQVDSLRLMARLVRDYGCKEINRILCEAADTIESIGNGTLTAEQVRECVQHVYYEGYNDGSVHRGHGIEETDWQAIADQLNAKLGYEVE